MSTDKKIPLFLIPLVLVPVFLLFFPSSLGVELQLARDWSRTIPAALDGAPKPGGLPFVLGNDYGRFSEDGRFLMLARTPFAVAQWGDFHVPYPRSPERLVVYGGASARGISVAAYPFFKDGRLFLAEADGMTVSEWSLEGALSHRMVFSAPLSAFDASSGLCVAGAVDGALQLRDRDGRWTALRVSGSTQGPVSMLAFYNDGNGLFILSDNAPQKLHCLARAEDGEWREREVLELGESLRRSPAAMVMKSRLFLELSEGRVLFFEPGRLRLVLQSGLEEIVQVADLGSGLLALHGPSQGAGRIVFASMAGTLLGGINAESETMIAVGKGLVVGAINRLVKFSVLAGRP